MNYSNNISVMETKWKGLVKRFSRIEISNKICNYW